MNKALVLLPALLLGCQQSRPAPAPVEKKAAAITPDAVPRVAPDEAHRRVQAGKALLVCAYEDDARWQSLRLEGSISLHELERRRPSPDQEIIFYCA